MCVCMQSADSVASLTADILQRVSSGTELHDTSHSIGQRTPLSPNTPVSSSSAGALNHPVVSALPSTPPLFHHWQSVDELRAQSAEDLKLTGSVFNSNSENMQTNKTTMVSNGRGSSGQSRSTRQTQSCGGERATGPSSSGSGQGSLSSSAFVPLTGAGTPPRRMTTGDNSGRSSKRRGMLPRNHSINLLPKTGISAKLTPLHEELHMECTLDGGGGEERRNTGKMDSPASHHQPTPPISRCVLLPLRLLCRRFFFCTSSHGACRCNRSDFMY
jgi:hypothetical protein